MNAYMIFRDVTFLAGWQGYFYEVPGKSNFELIGDQFDKFKRHWNLQALYSIAICVVSLVVNYNITKVKGIGILEELKE
jgi:hypothetical protein